MVEIKRGESEVTEGDQLTLDVRRDCDAEYLRRAETFIRRTVRDRTPFFVYFNHSLMHMPVIPREEFKGSQRPGRLGRQPAGTRRRLRRPAGPARRARRRRGHPGGVRRGQRPRGRPAVARLARLLGRLLLRRRRGQPAHPVHRPLARPHPGRADQRRDHARHRLVHHHLARGRAERAGRPGHRRGQPARLAHRPGRPPRSARGTSTGWGRRCTGSSGATSSSSWSRRSTCKTRPPSCPPPA